MNNHSIEELLFELNAEYLEVLKGSKNLLDKNANPKLIIDGLQTFWKRKRNKANHIITFLQQSFAQMRAQKTGTTSH